MLSRVWALGAVVVYQKKHNREVGGMSDNDDSVSNAVAAREQARTKKKRHTGTPSPTAEAKKRYFVSEVVLCSSRCSSGRVELIFRAWTGAAGELALLGR